MDALNGKVSVIGRLSVASAVVARALAERGGTLQRGLSRQTGLVVVARSSARGLASGRLQARVARADRQGTPCVSEGTFLRALGLLAPVDPAPAAIALDGLPDKVGLDASLVRLLVLYDLIEPQGGQCSFRDLVSAREVARLLGEGLDLTQILATTQELARQGPWRDHPLTRLKLVDDGSGHLARWIDGTLGELDGQLRLPLPAADNPSIDELFENAEEAEQTGDLATAESFYRRCVGLDKDEPIALFNLANVLCAQDRTAQAKLYLQRAVAIDPQFSEAWYNLALLLEKEGDKDAARVDFERAIQADPSYADPLYNLAHLEFEAEAYERARELWQRYLALDPDSEWSRTARKGLALCRREAKRG
jgi:tetratricopeptide (TPR) repeat protein